MLFDLIFFAALAWFAICIGCAMWLENAERRRRNEWRY